MKHIFVTGGVISSLGKGLAAASLGTLLEHRGLRVCLQKFDPYLNVDPGTMSPFQHGEVYVLGDGAETDLDLGHYERFTRCNLTRANSLTSGQVFQSVLDKERRGEYRGTTVQVIPHVTDEIKERLRRVEREQPCDVLITEVGGTTGDIEGLPFLEAIRQFILEVGPQNALILHITLVPYIKAAGELKTKPSQQSIARLREIGLQPQVLVCRCERPLDDDVRQKLSMFCNVPLQAVVEARDVEHTIYEMPLMLKAECLDRLIIERLGLKHLVTPEADMSDWQQFVGRLVSPKRRVRIAVVGKYIELQDAYKSIYESLTHAAAANDCAVDLVRLDAETLTDAQLDGISGILVPGGFGERGIEGKIHAARHARERGIPYFGICLGMQIAAIEFARNVCGLCDAHSTEFNPGAAHPVISLLDEQRNVTQLGGTMRLGAWPARVIADTRAHACYGSGEISERHRHRYEFNSAYREMMEQRGLVISATSPDGKLVEMIELADHPWYVACQFHPEFQSRPNHPHPLFQGFVAACVRLSSAQSASRLA